MIVTMPDSLLWYVAYGSNMSAARFARYLAGAADRTPPQAGRAMLLPGTVFFADESVVWGGGRAYYDPDLPGRTPARAHLITAGQFADVRRQEPPVYDRLLDLGPYQGVPQFTFTSTRGRSEHRANPPSTAYRDTIAAGLAEAHGWDDELAQRYLTALVLGATA